MYLFARLLTLMTICAPLCAQDLVTTNPDLPNDQSPGTSPLDEGQTWSHFGGNTRRQGRAHTAAILPSLNSPLWIATGDGITNYVPIAQSGIVVDRKRVYTLATSPQSPGANFAVAYNRFTGDFLWATPIPPVVLDSWSTPAIDSQHGQLIVAISQNIISLDSVSGAENWSTIIDGIVVNASPVVTSDLGDADRVFITNYSFGGGSTASLLCINTDPLNKTSNPYQPGEIVWQTPIGGDSSGNSPAYSAGKVYVASASSPGSTKGQIQSFDAIATSPPQPNWEFTNTINAGFFSGVVITRGHVYASSFSFTGLQQSANTVKINKQTGELVWSVPTNRTDATPVVLSNGDVVVSGGIATGAFDFLPFFGSLPSIQYISDEGSTASLMWDSALDTLDDINSNGIWDFGESFLSIGGWTHQPISLAGTNLLLVGTLPETTPGVLFGHNTDLQLVDLSKLPTDHDFISEQYSGTGSTPAMLNSWIYSPGAEGIHAFAPPSPPVISTREVINLYNDGQLSFEQLVDHLNK
jgi:hypothetical protein